jgi:hypothetical protein
MPAPGKAYVIERPKTRYQQGSIEKLPRAERARHRCSVQCEEDQDEGPAISKIQRLILALASDDLRIGCTRIGGDG